MEKLKFAVRMAEAAAEQPERSAWPRESIDWVQSYGLLLLNKGQTFPNRG